MWVSKLLFRILSAISSLVIIGLTAYTTVEWYGGFGYSYMGTPVIVMGPPAIVGFVWDVAEAICILARRGHRGIHPGAIVAIDLLLWLGFIAATVLYGVFHFFFDTYSYSYSSYYYSEATALVYISRATLSFGVLEVLFHLLLFIFGCYETSQRNRRPPMIIYPGAPHMAPGTHCSQYGGPIMLPAGQAPPAGYVPYAHGPTGTNRQSKFSDSYPHAVSPPPREPSAVYSAGNGEWTGSYH